jgi:hypothetical protein
VPLSALHDRQVYTVTAENRLQRRSVALGFRGDDYAVVTKGLQPNDPIVISDLVPAIDGMLLKPVADAQVLRQLLSSAGGGPQL